MVGPRRRIVRLCIGVVLVLAVLSLPGCSDTLGQAREAEANGDVPTAVSLYKERLNEKPDDLEALNGVAVLLYVSGDFDGALPYQQKVVALDPSDAQTRVELGFNYLNHQNAPEKAAAVMAEAAALEPTAKNLTFLAQAQSALADSEAAESSLRRAITVDGQYAYAYKILIKLLEQQGMATEATQVRDAAVAAGVSLGK